MSVSPSDAPRLPSGSVSPSAEIVEGSSVTLTCSSDANPAANYTWYKENQTLIQGPEGFYHFSSISSEDRGNYSCKSQNLHGEINSTILFIDVQCEYRNISISFTAKMTLFLFATHVRTNSVVSFTIKRSFYVIHAGTETCVFTCCH